ncbi:hypothetical protein EMIT047CA2_10025 [Pseudomonas soli]
MEAGCAHLPGDLPDDPGHSAITGAAVCPLSAVGWPDHRQLDHQPVRHPARGVLHHALGDPPLCRLAAPLSTRRDPLLGFVRKVAERRSGKAKTGEEAEFAGCK